MTLEPHHEALVLDAVRRVPGSLQGDARKYVESRLRPIVEPTVIDVDLACRETLARYGGRE